MSILDNIKKAHLDQYLLRCQTVMPELNVEEARKVALAAIRYYKGSKAAREELRARQDLEKRWYESVASGTPDFGVYDDDYFIAEMWACWVVYSRGYVRTLSKIIKTFGNLDVIADLGNGFGYTTAALKELWTGTYVYGTNLRETRQYRIAEALGKLYDYNMFPSVSGPIDLVVAFEYFEHFEQPIEHLAMILDTSNPKFLVTANAFGSTSIGHFPKYKLTRLEISADSQLDVTVSNKAIGRHFNKYLRYRGYEPVKTGFWNNRPAVWRRK